MLKKEQVLKSAATVTAAAELLKSGKSEEAIAKLEEAAEEIKQTAEGIDEAATEKVEEAITPDEKETIEKMKTFLSKFENIEEAAEKLNKWAYMSVDAQTVWDLIEQLSTLFGKDAVAAINKKVEEATAPLKQEIEKLAGQPLEWKTQEAITKTENDSNSLASQMNPYN